MFNVVRNMQDLYIYIYIYTHNIPETNIAPKDAWNTTSLLSKPANFQESLLLV